MKKFLCTLFIFLISTALCYANDIHGMKYKDIKLKSKIKTDSGNWSYAKKSDDYLLKTEGFGGFYDYLKKDGSFAFTTDCKYEFLYNNKLAGYSDKDFMFYEFDYTDGVLTRTQIPEEEIKNILSGYRIIKLSEFSPLTNSLKIKKGFGELRLLILNDLGVDMNGYCFTSGNAKFKTYPISGVITVFSKGMIQLSPSAGGSDQSPWYVLLVR
ncbi:hypothetical protein IKQ21_08330 [bacterium]|nr:hypothetical protein [bacterium]